MKYTEIACAVIAFVRGLAEMVCSAVIGPRAIASALFLAAAVAIAPLRAEDAAVSAGDCVEGGRARADQVIAACTRVIDNREATMDVRRQALIVRVGLFVAAGDIDRAIADYDQILRIGPPSGTLFAARGRLWQLKGERRKALADYDVALRLDPALADIAEVRKILARELEREGALMVLANTPTFDCAAARRPVEKAICADRALIRLDREIDVAYRRTVAIAERTASASVAALRAEQRAYLTGRNAAFGQAGYDLKAAMEQRLAALKARLPASE